jgi:hypothetical protein
MKVFVFLGPTLAHEEAAKELDAICLPPVAQGDVLRAVREGPFAIGIVDGVFERVPAVWHKEILWALSRGVHVFGAASMGALRAAELSPFGMQGCGEIFEAFQKGTLDDDDEVAVAHGEASSGYRATSEAMVNIRATLRLAEQQGVISAVVRERLESLAKGLFYPDRSYPALFAAARRVGLEGEATRALEDFVATHRVDRKRADALQMLRLMNECCKRGAEPPQRPWTFAHTETWEQVLDWAESQRPLQSGHDGPSADLIAAEVRLAGPPGRALLAAAVSRVAAGAVARRAPRADRELQIAATDRLIRDGVESGETANGAAVSFEDWLSRHDLSRQSYRELVESQANLSWFRDRYRDEIGRHLLDELRIAGKYELVSQRAAHKQRVLAERGLVSPTLEEFGLDGTRLIQWYFGERLGGAVPVDLPAAVRELGLGERSDLELEALREFAYMRCVGTDAERGPARWRADDAGDASRGVSGKNRGH